MFAQIPEGGPVLILLDGLSDPSALLTTVESEPYSLVVPKRRLGKDGQDGFSTIRAPGAAA